MNHGTALDPPHRSDDQRMHALDRANYIRSFRANLKRDLKARRRSIQSLIAGPPVEELETMKIVDLLIATPKYGRVKANRVLATCRISPSKTLGGLTERQRRELLSVMMPG